ncbi:MAG: hypothetical protein BAJALOKI3v1_20021 [Promethearchaeota archaeon]|nr:MAG: hypothetical protein BAJALOKI3v1_20021 [Candidatus Lokiarchaeota archaeon]
MIEYSQIIKLEISWFRNHIIKATILWLLIIHSYYLITSDLAIFEIHNLKRISYIIWLELRRLNQRCKKGYWFYKNTERLLRKNTPRNK